MAKKTLLDKAKNYKANRKRISREYSPELLDVAVAWLNDEIGAMQVMHVLDETGKSSTGGSYLYYVATTIREGVRSGDITIKRK